jgi:rhodanese-related sulfurtransferase/CBS domain-containing protein
VRVPKLADTSLVRRLVDGDAQLVEVLPRADWQRERLPGAVNIPLPEMRADAVASLDPAAPTVVYCYDHECDLSARAAVVLEQLGFTDVYDYADSKTAWLGEGLPADGDVLPTDRAGARATRPPTCGPDATIGDVVDDLRRDDTAVVVVVDDGDVVLGAVHPRAADLPASTNVVQAADPGPPTVRPSITRFELARSMDDRGQRHVLVSTSHGRLLGLVRRADLDGAG